MIVGIPEKGEATIVNMRVVDDHGHKLDMFDGPGPAVMQGEIYTEYLFEFTDGRRVWLPLSWSEHDQAMMLPARGTYPFHRYHRIWSGPTTWTLGRPPWWVF